MPFRFNAKRVFLTYPQCGDLSKTRLLEFLRDDRGALWYCVGLEKHEDGGNHLHAFGEWGSKLDVRDERHFDLDGQHPNIQPVRNVKHVLKYVQKGGDFEGNCERISATTVKYGDLLRESRGRSDFLERVIQSNPRDAVLYFERMQRFAEHYWPEERREYIPSYTTFDEPPGVLEWKSQMDVGKSLGLLQYPLMPILAVKEAAPRGGPSPLPRCFANSACLSRAT